MSNAKRRYRRRRRLNINHPQCIECLCRYGHKLQCYTGRLSVRFGVVYPDGRWRDSHVIWMGR